MTKAVLFDIDGTLIDSNDAHARAWVAALAEAGHEVPFERVRPLIGMGGDRVLPELVPGLTDDTEPGKSITKRRLEIFKERELPHLRPTRGARELLAAVQSRGARIVMATSAKGAELKDLLAVGDFEPFIDDASTSDDADSSKPAPDIVTASLKKAHVAANEAVMVGDTKYDVEAAHNAEVKCVALLCGGNGRVTLAAADAVYADPAELTERLGDPPLDWSIAASTAP